MESIRNFIFEYANLAVLIPLFVWFLVPAPRGTALKIILIFLLLSVITQLVSFIFWKLHKNNLPILHVYTVLECLVLLKLYSVLLQAPGRNKLFVLLAVLFSAFAVIDAFFLDGVFAYNTYSRSIEALIIISLCLAWFIKAASLDDSQKEMLRGMNIINSGFLIYFAGAVTLFACSSFLKEMTLNVRLNVWTMHTLLAVQLYILIAIGLWKMKAR